MYKYNKIQDELERFGSAVSQGHALHKSYTTGCRPGNPLGTIAYILRNTHGNCDKILNIYVHNLIGGFLCNALLHRVCSRNR